MSRREVDASQYWKRVQLVMKVQNGLLSAAEAAQELGLTVRHYYRLEEEMLRAALGAVTPEKPGPRKTEVDPVQAEMEEKLKASDRERELLKIKVQHLEQIQKEMVGRSIGVERGKKVGRGTGKGKPRQQIHRGIQADGPVAGRGTPRKGRSSERSHPGDGPRAVDSLPLEEGRDRDEEDGPQRA